MYASLHVHVGVVFILFISKVFCLTFLCLFCAGKQGNLEDTKIRVSVSVAMSAIYLHGITLKGGNVDNVVSCVHMGVQECVPSGEHLCGAAVHLPAVGSGLQVSMHGMCMCMCAHPSAVLQGELCICVRICSLLKAPVHV